MKTLGAARAIALVGEAFAWGPVLGGIGAGIGFVAAEGDLWIACGLLSFLLGMLCGAFRLRAKMKRVNQELYSGSVCPGTLGDCRWVPGKDGNWILWYEYGGTVDALTDCKKERSS